MKNRKNFRQMQPKTAHGILNGTKEKMTILVVDDDALIRKMATLMLEKRGYTVYPVAGAREAYAIAVLNQRAIDLILTDIMMPDMNGIELIALLRTVRRDFKVLYMSGYFNGLKFRIKKDDFIYKPFTIDELIKKVEKKLLTENSSEDNGGANSIMPTAPAKALGKIPA